MACVEESLRVLLLLLLVMMRMMTVMMPGIVDVLLMGTSAVRFTVTVIVIIITIIIIVFEYTAIACRRTCKI